jgi:hypothetical protein
MNSHMVQELLHVLVSCFFYVRLLVLHWVIRLEGDWRYEGT